MKTSKKIIKIKEKKMKLNIETLKKISRGAVRIEERDGYICFLRFTKAQEELYKGVKTDFYNKTFLIPDPGSRLLPPGRYPPWWSGT